MELENLNVPADKQDEKIVDTEFYIRYLDDCVEFGAISEEEALEIIEAEDWVKVEKLIDRGEYEADELLHSEI
jgi:hypothetical protein